MKLLVCTKCSDVFSLKVGRVTMCDCSLSSGYYSKLIPGHANILGPCIPIAFKNSSFIAALKAHEDTGEGIDFTAFVLRKDCPSVTHRGEKE